jgi:transcriptional regulator with XRE-family HTH domain
MARNPTPTVRRWQLGQELRRLREQADVAAKAAAAELEVSQGTLSKIEGGKQGIRTIYVKVLAQYYGVDDQVRADLLALAEEANRPEWYAPHTKKVPEWFRLFLGYESAASTICTYSAELTDGLLQTPQYAKEIAVANKPDATQTELDSYVAVRSGRQQHVIKDDPPVLHTVLNEAVLRRIVGSAEIMRDQLLHVVKLSKLRNVTVQVLPFSAGAHPAMTAPFSILKFDEYPAMDSVYLENGRGSLYLDAKSDMDRYEWVFQRISKLALRATESRELLIRMASDL